MTVLRSYVGGAWTEPADEGRPVLDAVTGEEVTRVSSAGIDLAAALDYGRSSGGPALRELTFHQRAALLKSLGQLLREHRQELYALSARTGATLGDSKFDVDGGIGVLLSYASRAKRELPNDTILAEGAVEPLSRGGTFVGQHILTPLHGVAVQVNAFNFPVWGPLEKFAPAFIAGMPSLVKPATQTAYLTARLVELIVGSGLLPDGAIQLVCGSIGGLFDHLGEQDLVAFTGSAATARRLRAHPAIVERSIRFNAEADSLNCSILGPEARPARSPPRSGGPWSRPRWRTRWRRRPGTGWPRWWWATPPRRAFGWGRWPAWSSARRYAVRSRPCCRPAGSCPATRTTWTWSGPVPSAARSWRRCCCRPTTRTVPSRIRWRRSGRSAPSSAIRTPQ